MNDLLQNKIIISCCPNKDYQIGSIMTRQQWKAILAYSSISTFNYDVFEIINDNNTEIQNNTDNI